MRPTSLRLACIAALMLLLSACGSSPQVKLEPTATLSSATPTVTVSPTAPAPSPTLVSTAPAPTATVEPTEEPAPTEAPPPTPAPVQTATATAQIPTITVEPTSTAEPATATTGNPTPQPTTTNAPTTEDEAVVVYQSADDGSIRAISLRSNTEVVLGDPTEPGQLLPWAASPDGRSIALITGRGWGAPKPDGPPERLSLWIVNLDASEPRKLLDLLSTEQPLDLDFSGDYRVLFGDFFQRIAWTPDGSEIVVVSAHEGQVDLYAAPVAGGQARRLTNTPELEFSAVISQDGSQVAYGTATSFGTGAGWGGVGAWAQPLSGGSPGSIIGQPVDGVEPASTSIVGWTADGSVIATTSSNVSGDTTIWVAGRGVEPRMIYYGSASAPAWNGQAGALAFTEQPRFGDAAEGSLYVWHPGEDAVTAVADMQPAFRLSWAPDGSRLLLCIGDEGSTAQRIVLWLAGTLHELGAADCQRSAWAADGSVAIAGTNGAGLVANPDGRVLRQLPASALLAGWVDDSIVLFRPVEDGWQLGSFVGDHDEAAIADVDVEPAGPTLVFPD